MKNRSTTFADTGSSGFTDTDREYLQKVTTDAYESWNEGKPDPYVDRYSEDVVYMAPNKETIIGKEGIRKHVMAFSAVHVEFPPSEIFGTSNLAIVQGNYVINDPEGNLLDKGKYLNVFQKLPDGNWVVTHDIHNSDLPVQGTE